MPVAMMMIGHLGSRAWWPLIVLLALLTGCRPSTDDRATPDDAFANRPIASTALPLPSPETARLVPHDAAPAVIAAGQAEHRAASMVRPTPASSRPRVLVLGDSLLFGAFGTSLEENLRARGAEVWLHGSCGASSVSFLRGIRSECGSVHLEPDKAALRVTGPSATPKLDSLLESVHPDAAVLVLGTNFLCCSAQAAPDVRELVDRLAEARVPCLWVGLPSFREPPSASLTRHYAMLETALANRCTLLDARSLGIDFRHVGDKVHVEPESGRAWAEVVASTASSRATR